MVCSAVRSAIGTIRGNARHPAVRSSIRVASPLDIAQSVPSVTVANVPCTVSAVVQGTIDVPIVVGGAGLQMLIRSADFENQQQQQQTSTENAPVRATIIAVASVMTDVSDVDVPLVTSRGSPALMVQVAYLTHSGITNPSTVIIYSNPQRRSMNEKGPARRENSGAPVGCHLLRWPFTSRRTGQVKQHTPMRLVYDRGKCLNGILSGACGPLVSV